MCHSIWIWYQFKNVIWILTVSWHQFRDRLWLILLNSHLLIHQGLADFFFLMQPSNNLFSSPVCFFQIRNSEIRGYFCHRPLLISFAFCSPRSVKAIRLWCYCWSLFLVFSFFVCVSLCYSKCEFFFLFLTVF